MHKLNEKYVACLRETIKDQTVVDRFIASAPLDETREQREQRLAGQYVEYYISRLDASVGKYYRNISQMSPAQKDKFAGQLEKLRKDIAAERDDLLKFVLIMPIMCPVNDQKSTEQIIYDLHLLLRNETGLANSAIKKALEDGSSLKGYYDDLLGRQVDAFSVAFKYGGTIKPQYLTIDEADPYTDLIIDE